VGLVMGILRWSAASTFTVEAELTLNVVWSVVYLAPLVCAALVIRRTWLSLLLVGLLTAAYCACASDAALLYNILGFVGTGRFSPLAARVFGRTLTVPTALLLWRCCGLRLVAPSRGSTTALPATTRTQVDAGPGQPSVSPP
jgi:hypothetical protein